MKKAIVAAGLMCMALCASSQSYKPWNKGAFETRKYRNLFVEMGYSKQAVDAKLQEVFNDVFYGPNKVYFEVGDSMAYVSDIKNHDARTEGMSYGLMLAVQFDKKDIFDRLWRWSKKYMQHQEGEREGYFAWSCKVDGTQNSAGAASDGELYFITALIFASNRWATTRASTTKQKHSVSSIAPCPKKWKDALCLLSEVLAVDSRPMLLLKSRRCS